LAKVRVSHVFWQLDKLNSVIWVSFRTLPWYFLVRPSIHMEQYTPAVSSRLRPPAQVGWLESIARWSFWNLQDEQIHCCGYPCFQARPAGPIQLGLLVDLL
jgi:hypothetical protein